MRTRKEVLQLLLDNIDLLALGLCGLAWKLHNRGRITADECIDIRIYIKQQRPKRTYKGYDYYWKPGSKKPRIVWLNKHIELNSNINL
jgi:hypothetical protein